MRLHISRFLSCLSILAFVGCDRMPGKPQEATPIVIGSPAWTQSTFNTNCRGCHSQGAEGAAIPLIDAGYWKVATDAQVIQVLAQGQGVLMPSYLDSNGGPLSSDQIAAFVKGMRTLWGEWFLWWSRWNFWDSCCGKCFCGIASLCFSMRVVPRSGRFCRQRD